MRNRNQQPENTEQTEMNIELEEHEQRDVNDFSKKASSSNTKEIVVPQKNYVPHLIIMNILLVAIVVILSVVIATTQGNDENDKVKIPNNGMTFEPALPGTVHRTDRPKIILGQDTNYPPYAVLEAPPVGLWVLGGFAQEVAKGAAKICDWDLKVVETHWNKCWDNGYAGEGMLQGSFHGCMSFTHTNGKRNRMLEFSNSILKNNKPGGLITRLKDGKPEITGMDSLDGKNIVDVRGWAPTDDGLQFNNNTCTGKPFGNFNMILPELGGNDHAMSLLLDGTADAVWIYADQGYKFNCETARKNNVNINWDCNIWDKFGTDFAYIHTGFMDQNVNGTTMTMSRLGSGLNDIVNPCLQEYMRSPEYHDLCATYADGSLFHDCYWNDHFHERHEDYPEHHHWFTPTNELETQCSDGYCPCNA